MIIDCIADTHGHYPQLEGGDLLIVAGDLTATDTIEEHIEFRKWIVDQKYRQFIVIAGNHDNLHFKAFHETKTIGPTGKYLCDSGTEFTHYPLLEAGKENQYERKTYKIWGSPWTKTFAGMNPHCKAFTCDTEEELAGKWAMIPEDTDILITHSPPLAMMDRNVWGECCGSASLCGLIGHLNLKLHIFGHIHECGGKVQYPVKQEGLPNYFDLTNTIYINCSHVNERYQPVNKPVRVIL